MDYLSTSDSTESGNMFNFVIRKRKVYRIILIKLCYFLENPNAKDVITN